MLNIGRYQGSKGKMLPYVLEIMPNHKAYVEVFGGSGVVILNKPLVEVNV